jgi:phosphoribosylformylglycinamidine synthase
MKRLFVEKKPAFRSEAVALTRDLRDSLRLPTLQSVRILQRYDIEGAADAIVITAEPTVTTMDASKATGKVTMVATSAT